MPVAIVGITQYYKYKMAQLRGRPHEDPKQLEKEREERKQLEARVQNLESIVCSVDLELNARMNRMLAAQSGIGLLPPHRADDKQQALSPTVATPHPHGSMLAMALQPGQKIAGRYIIQRELGRGGMGAVYLAADEKLNERVALKIINAGMADAGAADRFRREVSAARKVTHQNVIRIHDIIDDGPMVLLSMEYVAGTTLADYLGRVGALRIDEARNILGQICDGVAAAHAAGVVHRDLKPGNILIDGEKRAKVIDFGLAKATFMAGMTATGLIIGTPEYMAPEQVRGLAQDARTDVYSLGALSYHLFVGRPPFAGETPIAIGFAHVTETPRSPRALRPELPESVEAAIMRALEKDAGKRFADAAEFKAALLK
ncbi:MAG: serine/threonine protein kinase [Myxococcales bacterium]|nr:serine/threonine protein kinase [Myxococcales bacterium]